MKNLVILTGTYGYPELVTRIMNSPEIHKKYDVRHPKYKSILEVVDSNTMAVTHAGTGTIIELLTNNIRTIIVPNPTLKDNHQEEYTQSINNQILISTLDTIVTDLLTLEVPTVTMSVSNRIWNKILEIE
ncbi:beta-1,4-N-acetylglucosaminyltransferase [Nematocida sp. AWRm80]|nr:beta-1,4-N-acetylglucosaminyltransferase [Nematocida sp. AWRm80]